MSTAGPQRWLCGFAILGCATYPLLGCAVVATETAGGASLPALTDALCRSGLRALASGACGSGYDADLGTDAANPALSASGGTSEWRTYDFGATNPRNPPHFDTLGGEKRDAGQIRQFGYESQCFHTR